MLIAGDVINSVFAASVEPFEGFFGTSEDLMIPGARINAKVEGSIMNDLEVPDNPTQAFFAENVHVAHGPVTPPNVAEPPFPHPGAAPSGPRLAKTLLPTDPNAPGRRSLGVFLKGRPLPRFRM